MQEPQNVVAVFQISADANEDYWNYAVRDVEAAVRAAAADAGLPEEDLVVEKDHMGTVKASGPDGRQFTGRVVTKEGLPSWEAPRRIV